MDQQLQQPQPADAVTPAPYGRACVNCSRAKCKCLFRAGADSCERCARLHKDCQPSVSSRKRVTKKSSTSRTAQLEEKLNDLVSLLQQSHNASPPVAGSSGGPKEPPTPAGSSGAATRDGRYPTSNTMTTPSDSEPQNAAAFQASDPSIDEAEQCLDAFRSIYLPAFPCLYIPPTMDAMTLRAQKPFLWLCIMAVTLPFPARQLALSERARAYVSQRLVIAQERNMDLLQGLIVFIGWSGSQANLVLSCFKVARNSFEKPPTPRNPTMEERRATFCVFILNSMLSIFLKKCETLRWTSLMDESARVLDENPEWLGDRVLVLQAKLQLVMEQCTQADRLAQEDGVRVSAMGARYHEALAARIGEIERSISPELRQLNSVVGPLSTAKLLVADACVSSTPLTSPNLVNLDRLANLEQCLQSIKTFFDSLLTVPMSQYPGFSFQDFIHMVQMQVSLFGLSMLRESGWDLLAVRRSVNLLDYTDRIISKIAEVPKTRGIIVDEENLDIFTRTTRILGNMRASWAAEMNKSDAPVVQSAPVPEAAETFPDPVAAEAPDFTNILLSDDTTWLNELLMPWDDGTFGL